jgi:hypothetical protein
MRYGEVHSAREERREISHKEFYTVQWEINMNREARFWDVSRAIN